MNYTAEAIDNSGECFARLQTNFLDDCHALFKNLRHSPFTAKIIINKTWEIYRHFTVEDGRYFELLK